MTNENLSWFTSTISWYVYYQGICNVQYQVIVVANSLLQKVQFTEFWNFLLNSPQRRCIWTFRYLFHNEDASKLFIQVYKSVKLWFRRHSSPERFENLTLKCTGFIPVISEIVWHYPGKNTTLNAHVCPIMS